MEINLSSGITTPPPTLPGAKGADFPVQKVQQDATPQPTQGDSAAPVGNAIQQTVDEKRYEQVQKAAEEYFKNVYAVSDTRFTIYKDTTGQYITRYTSLRDGRVTYIPEPALLMYMQHQSRGQEALVQLKV